MLSTLLLSSCDPEVPRPDFTAQIAFDREVVSSEADLWWARAIADINGDGLMDIALQDNNRYGGWVGWLEATGDGAEWTKHIIAEQGPGGQTFAAGDLDAGDVDRDGDMDILAFEHDGEGDGAGEPTKVYWIENSGPGAAWDFHEIGEVVDFVKDVSLADLNADGMLDVVAVTFVEHNLTVFRQGGPASWTNVLNMRVDSLHEGMDVGDLDADGDVDIATNGYWIRNPGGDMTGEWSVNVIDPKWNTQVGDWSRNATKVAVANLDGKAGDEVFIAHSERREYPLSWYVCADDRCSNWREHRVIENWTAGHTLQTADFDLDGDLDVLSGQNYGRATKLGETASRVLLFLNQGDNDTWMVQTLATDGIYNGQVADFDNDGDLDILRLPSHDATVLELWRNQLRP